MEQLKKLTRWDFSDRVRVPDGCDTKSIPDITRDNLLVLIKGHNNLVEAVNLLAETHGVVFDENED